MSAPTVSVVVPTRNRPDWLERAIRSALNQCDVEVEVIVVDDGSEVAASAPAPVRILRNVRAAGPAAARNRGIAEARGQWVAFLDDDDLWAPDKLARQLALAGQASFVFSAAIVVDAQARPLRLAGVPDPGLDLARALLARNHLPGGCSNLLVRADALRAAGGFDAAFSILADWDLHIRLAAGYQGTWNRELHLAYTEHPHNMHHDETLVARELERLRSKHLIELDEAWWLRWRAGALRDAGNTRAAACALWRLGRVTRSPKTLARAGLTRARADALLPARSHPPPAPEWML